MIFKYNSFTQHALCCRARNVEFWEAVGRVPFDQRKFRKFEPVIFVKWKAPKIYLDHGASLILIHVTSKERTQSLRFTCLDVTTPSPLRKAFVASSIPAQ